MSTNIEYSLALSKIDPSVEKYYFLIFISNVLWRNEQKKPFISYNN